MANNTTQYNFQKPEVGADSDNWGDMLNGNWDATDSLLRGATALTRIGIGTTNSTLPLICNAATTADIAASFSGLVGIGTDNPAYTLDIEADTAQARIHSTVGNSVLRLDTVDTGESKIYFADNSASAIGTIEYHHDSNSMSFNTAATERMRIDSLGNVGIGTNDPEYKLQIKENVNGILTVGVDNYFDDDDETAPNPSTRLFLNAASNNGYLHVYGAPEDSEDLHKIDLGSTAATSFITFSPASTERMRISSSGKVGIGTSSPAYKLDVSRADAGILARFQTQDGTNNPRLTLETTATGVKARSAFGTGIAGSFEIESAGGNSYIAIKPNETERMRVEANGNVELSGGDLVLRSDSDDADTQYIRFENYPTDIRTAYIRADYSSQTAGGGTALAFGANDHATATDTDSMVIDIEGKVGIGTTNPSRSLDVQKSTIGDVASFRGSDAARELVITSSTTTSTGDTYTLNANSGNGVIAIATGSTERMRIDSSGYVGIGTTSPANTLTVGALEASSIYADATVGIKCNTNHKGIILQENSGAEQWSMGINANGDLNFYDSAVTDPLVTFQDNSGNVGIGTTNPTSLLDVRGSVNGNLDLSVYNTFDDDNENAPNPSARLYLSAVSNNAYLEAHGAPEDSAGLHKVDLGSTAAGSFMTFSPNGSEKMRIDSSGNVLVGKTASSLNTTGIQLQNDGLIRATKSGADVLQLNRQSTDGAIANFYKDGSTVGSIGTVSNRLYIGSGNTFITFYNDGNAIYPAQSNGTLRDNAIDIGTSSGRFDDIYATNGTIQTSDRNEKQGIRELLDAEQRVAVAAKGLLRAFKWNSAVEEKGDEARIHFGIIAQDLQDAFTAEGLDAGDYAMFINSTWTDEETGEERSRMGVRYSELLAFIISAI